MRCGLELFVDWLPSVTTVASGLEVPRAALESQLVNALQDALRMVEVAMEELERLSSQDLNRDEWLQEACELRGKLQAAHMIAEQRQAQIPKTGAASTIDKQVEF